VSYLPLGNSHGHLACQRVHARSKDPPDGCSSVRGKNTNHHPSSLGHWELFCDLRCTSTRAWVLPLLRRRSRDDHPRHFWIKPADTVGANDKIGRIENVSLDEIQHSAIKLRPLRLH
jgi:hypothetical protein